MFKYIRKQFTRQSYGAPIISIVVLLASAFFSVLTPAANVSADRLADITNCYNLLNGFNTRDFNTAKDPDGKRSSAFKVAPCRDFCKADFTTRAIDCNNPNVSILSPAQIATLKNTYGGPVAEIACKSSPIPEKQTCKNEFINQYVVPCINENVKNASTFIEDMASDAVAGCISARSGMNRSEVKASLNNARESVTKQQTEEIAKNEEKRKNDCAAKGEDYKVGENGQPGNCIPKQATATCQINGVGWIVCPVVSFMATLVDGAYQGVEALLIVPAIKTDTNSPMYIAWSIVRNFANVCFVIAFMFIIISQVSSVGINNYGIKKLLPKLVISAILVNVSYWLCAAAVDATNVVGSSIKPLVETIKLPANPNDLAFNDTLWTRLAGLALAGTALGTLALAGSLSILLPILIAAVLAIATVFIVLTARHAFIILFIVISPLAFVAYLLPNTEGLFKKWFNAFKILLLMFPIIAGVFALSRFAGTIVMLSAPDNLFVQIAGAGMTVIPLFITPIVMKAAGGMLSRIGAFVNNPNKGPVDFLRKGAGNVRQREKNRNRNRSLNGTGNKFNPIGRAQRALTRRGARIEAVDKAQQTSASIGEASYIAAQTQGNEKGVANTVLSTVSRGKLGNKGLADQMAAGGGEGALNRAQASAISAQRELLSKDVSAARELQRNESSPQIEKIALGQQSSSKAERLAAIQRYGEEGTLAQRMELYKNSSTMQDQDMRTAVRDIYYKKGDNQYFGGDGGDLISSGLISNTNDLKAAVANQVSKGKITSESVVGDTDATKMIADVLKEAKAGNTFSRQTIGENGTAKTDSIKLDQGSIDQIADRAYSAQTNPTLSGKIKGNMEISINDIISTRSSPPVSGTATATSADTTTHLGRTYEPNENGFLVPRK